MSGANTPKSKKRLRQALIDLMKGHQSGKQKLPALMLLKIIDRIGVLDGQWGAEVLITHKPLSSKYLGRYAASQEPPDDDEEVRKLREDVLKMRGEDANTHS
jgi:hypothetical protein